MILREGKGKYMMSLEHFVVPEGKEVLQNKRMDTCQRKRVGWMEKYTYEKRIKGHHN